MKNSAPICLKGKKIMNFSISFLKELLPYKPKTHI